MGHLFCYTSFIKEKTAFADRFTDWQANAKIEWRTSTGYMGWVEDRYILFASEYDYREYMEE